MQLNTLVKKYQKLGYTPTDARYDIDNIINWLWDAYKLHIEIHYLPTSYREYFKKPNDKFFVVYKLDTIDHENSFEEHFKTPYDAKFQALKRLHKIVSFNQHIYIKQDSK